VVNINEYGSDVLEAYGEIFSVTWKSDPDFDSALVNKLDD